MSDVWDREREGERRQRDEDEAFRREHGHGLIDTTIETLMDVRKEFAHKRLGKEFFDGAMSTLAFDNLTDYFMRHANVPQNKAWIARDFASNLMKLLYALEVKRYESDRNLGAKDYMNAAFERLASTLESRGLEHYGNKFEAYKDLEKWQQRAIREATRRGISYIYEEHGEARESRRSTY